MKSLGHHFSWVVLISLLSPLVFLERSAAATHEFILFTPEEAAQLRLTDDAWRPPSGRRGVQVGPSILVVDPKVKMRSAGSTIEILSPANLKVNFKKNLSPVDMSSLAIDARKGIFSRSLTERLRPFVRANSLEVEQLTIPSGEYRIQIRIADRAGAWTTASYRLIVGAK